MVCRLYGGTNSAAADTACQHGGRCKRERGSGYVVGKDKQVWKADLAENHKEP